MKEEKALYNAVSEAHGNGMFFYTTCCNSRIYSVKNDEYLYHKCLCPNCAVQHKKVTLYYIYSEEGKKLKEEMDKSNG